jgi:hypothetical protein
MADIQIDFEKVFSVLRSLRCDSSEEYVDKACFKSWSDKVLMEFEGVLAYLIRLAFLIEVMDVMRRLNEGEGDRRDVLFFLVAKGLGLKYLSEVVDAAEKGLERLYDERDFKAFSACLEKMLDECVDEISKKLGEGEVMIQ